MPITLAHDVATRPEVDEVLATARAAGATRSVPAEERESSGYTGYFADPDGFRWRSPGTPAPSARSCCPESLCGRSLLPGGSRHGPLPLPLKPATASASPPRRAAWPHLVPRFEACVALLRQQGYDVMVGQCLDGRRTSAPPRRSGPPS